MVRKRGGRKRALGTRAPMEVPRMPDDRWSLDFVSDQLACGRRFRILAIFDDCTRECLAAVADTSLSGGRVARELDHLIALRGKPKMIVSENELRVTRLQIMLSPEELQALDDFRFAHRMPSRAATFRELLRRGLASEGPRHGHEETDE